MKQLLPFGIFLGVCACDRDHAASDAQPGDNRQSTAASGTPGVTGDGGELAVTNPAEGAEGSAGGAPASTPRIANGELSWNASTTSRGHKLTYGRPQTDDVRAVLRCASRAQVTVQISPPKRPDRPPQIEVISGGARQRVAASVSESMLGGLIVEGNLARNSAVLRNFRSGQPLSVRWASYAVTVPANSQQISTFFDRCR